MELKPNPTLIDGTVVNMGGVRMLLPSLNFRQMKALKANLDGLAAGTQDQDQFMTLAAPVIFASITRNYSGVSLDDMEDLLDLNNVADAVKAVMGQSGLVVSGEAVGMATVQ